MFFFGEEVDLLEDAYILDMTPEEFIAETRAEWGKDPRFASVSDESLKVICEIRRREVREDLEGAGT